MSRDDRSSDRIEDLVFECLQAEDREEALGELERQHTDLAPRVRAALSEIEALSLGPRATDETLPRRLGQFELTRRLGTGGMGVVYAARDLELDREVAVKLIRLDQLDDEQCRQRFQREVAAVARLKHPGIISIHTAGTDGDVPYYSMELVEGDSLAETLQRARSRPFAMLRGADLLESRSRGLAPKGGTTHTDSARVTDSWVDGCTRIIQRVAEALQHAHERGVFHRDVKPSNILVDGHGRPLLLDFGLARLQESQQLTRTATQLGSLPYMPPEIVEGRVEEYGARQDVYSLGITFYELLTLESPFLGRTPGETRRRIVAGQPRRPRSIHPQISWDAETVCLTAMDRDPGRRYESAQAFADDLGRALAREPIHAQPPGWLLRMRRLAQRHPAWAVGLPLAFLLFVVGPIVFGIYSQARARTEKTLRTAAERVAKELAKRTDEFRQLKHVVLLDRVRRSYDGLPGWPDSSANLRAWLDQSWAPFQAALPEIEAVVGGISDRRDAADGRPFTDPADQFLHENLARLLADARAFAKKEVADVEARLAWSERVPALTERNPGARVTWAQARAAICAADGVAASELYRRSPPIELAPQLGLVPIGRNPATKLWEFYHLRSAVDPETIPRHDPETGHIEVGPDTGIVFVLVPGGVSQNGAQATDPEGPNYDPMAQPHEGPVHEVTLDPFFVARHEMTQGQWMRLGSGDNPSIYGLGDHQLKVADPVTLAHPVENVTWEECHALTERHGLALPTEAQWEYACRAGSGWPWWTGPRPTSLRGAANLCDRTVRRAKVQWGRTEDWLEDGYLVHAPVSTMRSNGFGLHHVLGNVWEWCLDPTLLYARVAPEPGTGLRATDRPTKSRTQRGGACNLPANLARCSLRNPVSPAAKAGYTGLRPVRAVRQP